jgi:DNA-binding NarL/FixJ family response regulator
MKILLVDDHKMMRDGLRALLEREPDMDVVGEAADGHQAIEQAAALSPDAVVMDISMPGLNGIEATRRIVEAHPGMKVVGLSINADRRYVRAIFEAGAVGYLLKNAASDELIQALRVVARSQHYVSPAIAGAVVEGFVRRDASEQPAPQASPAELSSREREVLQLLAEGKTSKDVAQRLGVAVSTVETYRRGITAKLGIHTVAELTKYAIRHGLTSVD